MFLPAGHHFSKLILFIFLLLPAGSFTFSQNVNTSDTIKEKQTYSLEDIIQSYIESREEDGDFDYNTILDRLEYLQKHKVNINNEDELDELILLRPSQIENIKTYIRAHGTLISIYELQAIPGMNVQSIKMILPFISLQSGFENYQVSVAEMIKYSGHQLFFRTNTYLQKQSGYDLTRPTHYLGNPYRYYIRYRQSYENKLSIGITAEKDPGELFFTGKNKNGFDYYSFHFALRNFNTHVNDLVIGDYNLSMGQGLIMHSGFGVGKSPWATNIRKAERSIRPYSSVNESNFLRGAAINYKLTKQLETTIALSFRAKDANITSDSSDRESIFSSFQESGYHRTPSEIADKNSIKEKMIGVILKYRYKNGHIAINSLYSHFNSNFQKQTSLYNLFTFTGRNLLQYSMDHSYQIKNFNFFGEVAWSNPGSYALNEGLQLALDKKLDVSVFYRNLDKKYPAIYSNAFSENTLATNEQGIYFGTELRPDIHWKISGYYDLWSHDWLRFNVQAPTVGNEYLVRFTYTIRRKMEAYVQFRNKTRQENNSIKAPIKSLSDYTKKSLRFHLSYNWSKSIETRSRMEISSYSKEEIPHQNGLAVFQDFLYQSINSPLSFTSRIAFFNTDSYDSGIYAYENDLLYNFYVPNYNGKGWRYYLNLRYGGIRNLTLEARYANTSLYGVNSIGSGLDKIIGNNKSEVKLQVRWVW